MFIIYISIYIQISEFNDFGYSFDFRNTEMNNIIQGNAVTKIDFVFEAFKQNMTTEVILHFKLSYILA